MKLHYKTTVKVQFVSLNSILAFIINKDRGNIIEFNILLNMSMYENCVLVFIYLNTKVLGYFGLNVTPSATTKRDLITVREVFV